MALRFEHEAPFSRFPLVQCWNRPDKPLPLRTIRFSSSKLSPGLEPPPWLETGPFGMPFHFSEKMHRLCTDIVSRCEPLHHVDMSRLLIAVTQARTNRPQGLQARVTPFRFRNGSLTRRRRGFVYQVQRYFVGPREILYMMTFCLPRYLEMNFDEKFVTLFHELYHINPAFDGDLRRHPGRYLIHSRSQRRYDQQMADLARSYLANGADPALHDFLRLNFTQLQHRHGNIIGIRVPRPKLVPVYAGAGIREQGLGIGD